MIQTYCVCMDACMHGLDMHTRSAGAVQEPAGGQGGAPAPRERTARCHACGPAGGGAGVPAAAGAVRRAPHVWQRCEQLAAHAAHQLCWVCCQLWCPQFHAWCHIAGWALLGYRGAAFWTPQPNSRADSWWRMMRANVCGAARWQAGRRGVKTCILTLHVKHTICPGGRESSRTKHVVWH